VKKRDLFVFLGFFSAIASSYSTVLLDDDLYVAAHSGLSVIGWHANIGTEGVAADENNVDGFISPIAAAGGYIFYQLPITYTNAPILNWTDKAMFGSVANVTNMSATLRNLDPSENIKFSIKVDGVWYVSQMTFNNPLPDTGFVVSLDVHASLWNSLSLDPGTTMIEGAAVTLPSAGTVQGVGLFDTSDNNQRVRIDHFTVEGISDELFFEEDFFNAGGNMGVSNLNWHANGTAGAVLDEGAWEWYEAPIIAAGDYLAYNITNSPAPMFCWTEKESSFGQIENTVQVTLALKNASISADLKLALKVNDTWYVSQEVLNNPVGNTLADVSLAVQSASWNSLDFVSGVSLFEGGPTNLPVAGALQAVGFFEMTATDTVRVYNYKIEGIAAANRIVCIGDSITQANLSHFSFRYELWKRLAASGVSFDLVGSTSINNLGSPARPGYAGKTFDQNHEGHWGWRADQILAGLPSWLAEYTPDVALIHLGSNDMNQGNSHASTKDEIKEVIAALRADNPDVVILLCKLIPWNGKEAQIQDLNENYIASIPTEIGTERSPIILVDQFEGIDVGVDLYDGIHPSESGELKVATQYYEALRPYLSGLVDEDSDRMHDQWEIDYFGGLSRDGTGFADDDEYSDLSEFVLGSDPTNSLSSFHLNGGVSGGQNQLDFQTVEGRIYRIESTDSLVAGGWMEVELVIGSGAATHVVYAASESNRFYRVQVERVQ